MSDYASTQPAYVLHRRAYRDTSLLIDLFTHDNGKISVIAKGAKRPKSPLRASLQMFQPLYIDYSGKHELQTLRSAEIQQALPTIKPDKLAWGFYLNELLYRLLGKHEPFPAIYQHYQSVLTKLAENTITDLDLRYFELELLTRLGYGLHLEQDVDGKAIVATQYYLFEPEQGLIKTGLIDKNRKAYLGADIIALAKRTITTATTAQSAKRLLRHALNHQLDYRPLKSREMLVVCGK